MARRKPIERVYTSALSVSPTACHHYYVPVDGFKPSRAHTTNAIHLEDNQHDGIVSCKGRKRLEKSLAWLIYYSKPKKVTDMETKKTFTFNINFITLTISSKQMHSDKEITKVCLGSFLDKCRKMVGLKNYIWRAEAQANGNIHFHLVTDTYIHYNDIRKWWNQSQELLGYVTEFSKKYHHFNPNSVDVHSVKHIQRICSYLGKYMTKERAFQCIGELRRIKGEVVEVLYGSDKYRSERANRKEGKVIGHILGGRIRLIESKLWASSQSLSKCANIKVLEDEYRFSSVVDLINSCDFRQYNGEFVTSMYGDFKKVVDVLLVQNAK
jgi:hypothetical protein